ncbi:MAG TPA: ribulose-phosphate 3-epimerase [Bacteroidales bacterium]|nr:ribulose-phosphate 3-epimerase [Bacteroidales bacterium]HQQ21666.1 ribulose-phosphate 3-epimerase [Bacteroidales bacterium]
MKPIISPSLLSADFGNLERDIRLINQSEADYLHLDIMDGHFVPNITFGMPVISAIRKISEKPLDVHLMIENPERYLADFKKAGADMLAVHWEASTHLHRTVHAIRDLDMLAGVALNPHTPVTLLEDIIQDLDFVLIMSVNPGFGGQEFIKKSLDRIRELKDLIIRNNSDALIEVDGGVNQDNCLSLVEAGADILVAGNAIFKSEDPLEAIHNLRNCTTEK